jgi:hypothetical protein
VNILTIKRAREKTERERVGESGREWERARGRRTKCKAF